MPILHSYHRIAMMVCLAALTGATTLISPTFLPAESGPSAGAYAFVLFSPGSRGAKMSGFYGRRAARNVAPGR
jgi:hypothetical protein